MLPNNVYILLNSESTVHVIYISRQKQYPLNQINNADAVAFFGILETNNWL